MRYHRTSGVTKILHIDSDEQDHMEQQKLSLIAGRNAKWYTCLEKSVAVSDKINHTLTIPPSNHALCCYPDELKIYFRRKIHNWLFIAMLFPCHQLGTNHVL